MSPNDGLVLTQSIAPGQLAPAGTTIELVVGVAADPPPRDGPAGDATHRDTEPEGDGGGRRAVTAGGATRDLTPSVA